MHKLLTMENGLTGELRIIVWDESGDASLSGPRTQEDIRRDIKAYLVSAFRTVSELADSPTKVEIASTITAAMHLTNQT